MSGHHLVLGKLTDCLTGEILDDTLDERYRQNIANLLVSDKGYEKKDIRARLPLMVKAGERQGQLWVDYTVTVDERTAMVIKYAPGSLVTRHRPTLAIGRLAAPYQIPVVVITNGETADILDGTTGASMATGLDGIPSRAEMVTLLEKTADAFAPISPKRAELEARIVYAYEIDGACPCDDSTCRIE